MPGVHYSRVIEEDPQRLKELEKYHRYTHLFQRVRMLRLLKSEEVHQPGESQPEALGYSWRQCQRWFRSYQQGGLQELLNSRVSERGRQELVTQEAFEEFGGGHEAGGDRHHLRGRPLSLGSATASSTLTPMASASSSGGARSSSRRAVRATKRPTKKSRRLSKKLRR